MKKLFEIHFCDGTKGTALAPDVHVVYFMLSENEKTEIVGIKEIDNHEAGSIAVKISEMAQPPLTGQDQAFFIAGFQECVKWMSSNGNI